MIDLTGQKFGRLTALYPVPNNTHHTRWHCVCECGNTKDVLQQNLCNGHVQSCGCLLAERNAEKLASINSALNRELHNETKTRLYHIWIGIKSRCFDADSSSYRNYGGRGISVCNEWANSYTAFKDWALSAGYTDNLSIDRIDVDGDYSPNNCRWVSNSTQQFNKRKSNRNTSGHVGVSWNKKERRWVAYITKDHVVHWLGLFDNIDDAIKARETAETMYYGQISPNSQ
jgi:hypothetical protein